MSEILPTISPTVEASLTPQISWKQELKSAIRSSRQLCEYLGLTGEQGEVRAESDFPVLVPRNYLDRMTRGNLRDPLLMQVLAGGSEDDPGGIIDPVGDLAAQQQSGLLQKYATRVLLITTGACAVHCRYCFRRHFPYESISKSRATWESWLDAISDDPTLEEVILSGGDPLMVADETLAWFADGLREIEHVKRLRIHTRLPVVIPSRICSSFLQWLSDTGKANYVVLHFNHVNEVSDDVVDAIARLRGTGTTVLNQTVLLKGINDCEVALTKLFSKLVNIQVLPYYLHQLDPVRGAKHFEVSDERAREIVDRLRSRLPGYGVPQLVRELPGEPSKTPL